MQIINILDYINTAGCNCVTAGRAVGSRHSVKLIFSSFIDLNFFSFFFTVNFVLPPTPPSSASSDSEGNVSPVRDVTSPKSDESQRRSSTSASSVDAELSAARAEELRELERELECPVCMDISKPPIYQCEEGHIIW